MNTKIDTIDEMKELYFVVKIKPQYKDSFEITLNSEEYVINYYQTDINVWNECKEVYDNDDEYDNSE